MSKTTMSGFGLILFALALMVFNLSDTIRDLKEWHDATNPAIAAVLLKQAASVIMSAVGGTLLPQMGTKE